jgi:hypothetical protein
MKQVPAVERAIRQGLSFLRSAQKPDGSFDSFSSPSRAPFKAELTYQTTFTPALILAALNPVAGADGIRQSLAQWLLDQKTEHWSFNYWAKDAAQRRSLPYPDDLDDTFCALLALYEHDKTLVDGAALGSVVQLLVAAETQAGGPYRTWLVGRQAPKVWQDVDPAVNSNIAYFLQLVAEPLPNLTQLMEQAIQAGRLASPYYPSAYPLAYYLARAYQGPQAGKLAALLQKMQGRGHWGTAMQTALSVSALTRLGGGDTAQAVEFLVSSQLPDGSWPAEAFCLDPAMQGKTYYCGAPALTTALVLEALTRAAKTAAPAARALAADKKIVTLKKHIAEAAEGGLTTLDPALKKSVAAILTDIQIGGHYDEISLLPYLFNQGLAAPLPGRAAFFAELGLANLYGWMAYTIFDDFLDDEGKPPLLPAASLALRRSLGHFRDSLPEHQPFQRLVEQTFDVIDAANAWEVTACRFRLDGQNVVVSRLPDYGKRRRLAERSLGHTLTPLAVLAAGGHELAAPAVKHLRQALEHYLIARQLNDDLHDWEPDMRAGHATYVVTTILGDLGVKPGMYKLEPLIAKMQQQFWHHSLLTLCDIILEHTALARQHAQKSDLLTDDNAITKLLDGIDAVVHTTRQEQTKAEQFLAAYQKNE